MCVVLPPEFMQYGASGAPVPSIEVKFLDVADAGYLSTNPLPQGEILLRGPSVTKGYYKRDDLNNDESIFTKDGWLRTGDVGQWNRDGTLSIIDRIKNLVKLQGGEVRFFFWFQLSVFERKSKLNKYVFLSFLFFSCFVFGGGLYSTSPLSAWNRSTNRVTSSPTSASTPRPTRSSPSPSSSHTKRTSVKHCPHRRLRMMRRRICTSCARTKGCGRWC